MSVFHWGNTGKGMDRPSKFPERKLQDKKADADPLASPTLAALYAAQGHTDVAEAIYKKLGRRPAEGALPEAGRRHPGGPEADTTFLERLLSLRKAARRVREAGYAERTAGG